MKAHIGLMSNKFGLLELGVSIILQFYNHNLDH